ncbi:MAG: lamin tail domain-containing protein [Deltaproteobacteria bacterium]|nr:lamin tail domain-containing protein [Deltaproteobacteria bacterium]
MNPSFRLVLFLALVTGCTQLEPREGQGFGALSYDGDVVLASDIPVTTTIQAAIELAEYGDTVLVPAGTFYEDLRIAASIVVRGAGQGQTFLVGQIDITGMTETTLQGMTVTSPAYDPAGSWTPTGTGVDVDGDGGIVHVRDVGVFYFKYGLYTIGTANSTIGEVTAAHNKYGIYSEWNIGQRIQNSLVRSNIAAGIFSTQSTGLVAHNTLFGNGFGGTALALSGALALGAGSSEQVVNNLLASNAIGVNCADCGTTMASNLVWGNAVDYAGDASASPDDLSADPLFEASHEGNFHLSAASPCIDRATPVAVDLDFDGHARPQGGASDIGHDEYVVSGYALVITEVLANAAVEATGEFVEIYNAGGASVDLAGLVFSDGGDLDTLVAWSGGSTTVDSQAYAVLVDPDYDGVYGIDAAVTVVTTADTTLGNGLTTSDRVTLYEPDGTAVIAAFTHPSDPGDGVSLEMIDLSIGDRSGNWRASVCPDHRSPGGPPCFAPSGDPAGLVLTEVMANALDEATGEFVEVYNPTSLDIDLAGLVVSDGSSSDSLVAHQGGSTLLGPGSHGVIVDPDLVDAYYLPAGAVLVTTSDATIADGLSNASDSVFLYKTDGTTLIDAYSFVMDPGNGVSMEKRNYAGGNSSSNWTPGSGDCPGGHSIGRLNGAAGGRCEALLITEVMANALDEDTGEFIEIRNAGTGGVEMDGLVFTDGDAVDYVVGYAGGNSFLEAGGFAVILDSEYAGEYDFPPDTILLTTLNTTLGNSLSVSDPITLFESDGVHVLDAFRHPDNPGNGISMERLFLDVFDDWEEWAASVCPKGASPGAHACADSESYLQSDLDEILVITEIMSNPLVESTGEFVELYNAGVDPLDLADFVLFDGDANDTLQGFTDPTNTVLGSEQYAVILDAGYAGEYTIPAGVLLLTTDDATLASGLSVDDPVYLYEANGISLIDSYTWTMDPGNGTSVEKVVWWQGDQETNWAVSACGSGSKRAPSSRGERGAVGGGAFGVLEARRGPWAGWRKQALVGFGEAAQHVAGRPGTADDRVNTHDAPTLRAPERVRAEDTEEQLRLCHPSTAPLRPVPLGPRPRRVQTPARWGLTRSRTSSSAGTGRSICSSFRMSGGP